MYLSPLHFQTQTRHQEDTLSFLVANLWNVPWGLSYLELDTEAVRNGNVSLVRAAGLLPDGLPFDFPASDELPPTRSLRDLFSPSDASLQLYLAVPRRSASGQVVDLEQSATTFRYSVMTRGIADETNGMDIRDLTFGKKNLAVLAESELTDDMIALPLARAVRDGRGQFFYDPDFIPPCLQIGASDALMPTPAPTISAVL